MYFFKKRKNKGKGKEIKVPHISNKNKISREQMRLINDRILSKKRLIVYAESQI